MHVTVGHSTEANSVLEEPFAVIHKATLHVMLLERNKDNKSTRTRRTAGQLYTSVGNLVQRVVDLRWRSARNTRRADGGWLQRRKQDEHALHIHVADVLASKGARGVETYAATVS